MSPAVFGAIVVAAAIGVAAAAAVACMLFKRELARWRENEASLQEKYRQLQDVVAGQQSQIAALWASQSVVFTVAQYNILAAYLGDNRQPWFLYGLPNGALTEERRHGIMKKFYERGADGKYCNIGWPNYVCPPPRAAASSPLRSAISRTSQDSPR